MHTATRLKTALPGVETISITSDQSFPRHSHDEFGFGYVVSGGQQSWSGRGLVEAQAGDIITVNAGELHDGIGISGAPRHWRMIYIRPDVIAGCADVPAPEAEFHHPVMRDAQRRDHVIRTIAAAMQEGRDPHHFEEAVLIALRHLIGESRAGRSDAPACSHAVRRMRDRIHADWAETLTLSDLADTAGLSRYQALRHFSKQIGTTPHGYLTQHRVKQARRHIINGMALAEAALAAGFADQSHMTRAFRRQFGLTPGSIAAPYCNIVQSGA